MENRVSKSNVGKLDYSDNFFFNEMFNIIAVNANVTENNIDILRWRLNKVYSIITEKKKGYDRLIRYRLLIRWSFSMSPENLRKKSRENQ